MTSTPLQTDGSSTGRPDRATVDWSPAADLPAIVEQPPVALLELKAWPQSEDSVRAVARERLRLELPGVGAAASNGAGRWAIWVGPLRWWIVEERNTLPTEIAQGFDPADAAVIDLSHARARFRLCGAAARTVLMRLADLDFHPAAFAAGRVAQTLAGHVPVLIHLRDDAPTFDVYVPCSYRQSFWELLAETGAECGAQLAPGSAGGAITARG